MNDFSFLTREWLVHLALQREDALLFKIFQGLSQRLGATLLASILWALIFREREMPRAWAPAEDSSSYVWKPDLASSLCDYMILLPTKVSQFQKDMCASACTHLQPM